MKYWKGILAAAFILVLSLIAVGVWQYRTLRAAHSSFENYYAFRGCTQLLERTDTYGTCLTNSGSTIKIVKYENRWFLDGDLPCKTGICW